MRYSSWRTLPGKDRVSWDGFHSHVFSTVGKDVLGLSLKPVSASSLTMSLSPTATTSNGSDVPSKRRRTNSIVPINNNSQQGMSQSPAEGSAHLSPSQPSAHIPKRGARACTACRKGKNRCEGEVSTLDGPLHYRSAINSLARPPAPARHRFEQAPCRRCQLSGTPCIFEKPEKKNVQPVSGASVECVHIQDPENFSDNCQNRRLSRLEGQYLVNFKPLWLERLSPEVLLQVMQSQMIGMQSSLDRILSAVQSQGQSNHQQPPGYATNIGQASARDAGPSYPPRSRYVRYTHSRK